MTQMKRLVALLMTLGLLLMTMISGVSPIIADDAETTLVVHKILMTEEAYGQHKDIEYDPEEKLTDLSVFGDKAKEIENVYFVALKEGDANISKAEKGDFSFVEGVPDTQKGLTTSEGLSLTLPDGSWKIYEVKSLTTYVGPDKELLEKQLAVPINITLPYIGPNGKAKTVHVYPKNTQNKPPVDKTIGGSESDKKQDSYDFDQVHKWYITSKIPADIKDHKAFKFTDELQNTLTYVGNVKVYVGDGRGKNDTELGKGTHYELIEPTASEGGTLIVDFSDHCAALGDYAGKDLTIVFEAKINRNAVMGQEIPNNVKLTYGHNPNNLKEVEPSDPPKVYTGGKKFKKVDGAEQSKALDGAEFVVENEQGEYLVEKNQVRSWVKPAPGQKPADIPDVVKLISDTSGLFEVKGLAYGTYHLVETKAPKGYALPSNPKTKFTVDATSYHQNPTAAELIAADPQLVLNTKMTIPHTGGIGTIIFTVVGLLLMAISVISLRRKKTSSR